MVKTFQQTNAKGCDTKRRQLSTSTFNFCVQDDFQLKIIQECDVGVAEDDTACHRIVGKNAWATRA
jgi:hypothetical protein